MRKILCLLLALLILSVGSLTFAFHSVNNTADQVELKETVLYGDKSKAEGLTVRSQNNYRDRCHWDTTYVIGAQPVADTAYRFTAEAEYNRSRGTPRALYLTTQINAYFSNGAENPSGLSQAYQELYESMGPNEEKEIEVYVKDYHDFYPITGWLELPGCFFDWDPLDMIRDRFTEEELAIIEGMENFFRIPVLEDDKELIALTTNTEKEIVGSGSGSISGDDFYLDTISPYTDEAIYIVFDAHTNEGEIIDTSYIPGGYGIYRLPYHAKEADTHGHTAAVAIDELAMVYPLDPNLHLYGMTLSGDKEQLLLYTREENTFYLTVIDVATMDTLQKLELGKWREDTYGWRLFDENENFLAFTLNDGELVVAERQDNGTYTITLRTELRLGESDSPFANFYLSRNAALAYDGERLAVIDSLQREYTREGRDYSWREYTCGFFTAVYDNSGLVHFGTYESSLDAGEDLGDQFSACLPDYDPLSARWS